MPGENPFHGGAAAFEITFDERIVEGFEVVFRGVRVRQRGFGRECIPRGIAALPGGVEPGDVAVSLFEPPTELLLRGLVGWTAENRLRQRGLIPPSVLVVDEGADAHRVPAANFQPRDRLETMLSSNFGSNTSSKCCQVPVCPLMTGPSL